MVVPLGAGDIQIMNVVRKSGRDSFITSEHGAFRFVPMLQDKAR
jgi:hypothetical protein